MKIGIVVGHNFEKKGAVNYAGVTEYDFNCAIAEGVRAVLSESGININIFKKDSHPNIFAADLRYTKPNFLIELHFNSFSKEAFGSEVLLLAPSRGNEKSREMGLKLLRLHENVFKISPRGYGIKQVIKGDRGFSNLNFYERNGVFNHLIFEPVFGNFPTPEAKNFFERQSLYISTLSCYIASCL